MVSFYYYRTLISDHPSRITLQVTDSLEVGRLRRVGLLPRVGLLRRLHHTCTFHRVVVVSCTGTGRGCNYITNIILRHYYTEL